jgi:hypothetical protein
MPKSFSESKCGIQLSQAAAGILSKTELNQLFGQIDHQRLQTQASKAVSNVAGKFLDQHAYQASLDRRTAIFNKMRQTEMTSRLREWIKQGVPAGKAEAGMVAGDSGRSGLGFQDNPADRRDKMQRREQILIHSQLKKEKLEKYAMAPGYDAAVDEAQERQNTTDPQAKSQLPMTEYGKLKPHEQKAVERIAELYNQQLDRLRGNASNVGALISKREGYMGEQTHEKGRIRNADRAGKNFIHDMPTEEARRAWSKDMDGWLDMDKTRASLVKQGRLGVLEDLDPAKFKDRLWDIFAGGPRRGGSPEGAKEAGAKMGSGGNLLAEAEKARVLEFKDAKSFSAYRAKYGKGSKWISHLGQIDNMAHTIETLRTLGPSPENNFMKARETIADELSRQKDELRAKNAPDSDLLKVQNNLDSMSQGAKDGKVSTGHRYLADYLGSDPVGHKSWWDHLTDSIMAFERVTNLGGSLFSALPSFYTSALESSRYGGGILPAAARTTIGATTNLLHKSFGTLFGILGSLPPTEKMEWARQYGVGMDAAHGQIKAAVLGRQQWAPGSTWAKFENKFFNLVGLPQFLDSVGTQHVADISGKIARQFGNTFDKLPPEMARTLRDYNISPQEWELIRKYTGHEFNNLHTVVSADGMREAPLDEVKSTLGVKSDFAANAAKQDIEDKLASLHADSADIGRVFHNFKTGQIIKGLVGDSPLSRLTMQFATFNFAHGQRVLWRHYNERSKMDFAFKVLGGLTLTGMLAYTARQILQGKNPTANPELYDNSDPSKMGEAWAKYAGAGAGQAGVGGMVGDLLFSQTYNNGRGSALQPLAGPAGDDAMQLFQFAHDATGKGKIDSDQMLKFAQGKTPFANVWWIKPLINYGMMYGIHENLNPGTLERSEQHAKQSGDPYWAPPSQYANRP